MIRNIFLAIIAFAIVFMGYHIYQTYLNYVNINNVPDSYAISSDHADLTVVAFLDYACSFCHEIHPIVMDAIERDGRIRYIPRPVASPAQNSAFAAIVNYASGNQGKFIDMHLRLMTVSTTDLDTKLLHEFVTQMNIDWNQFLVDLQNENIKNQVYKNGSLFKMVGGTSTPTFIIGDTMMYVPDDRMPTVEDFLNFFEKARGAS